MFRLAVTILFVVSVFTAASSAITKGSNSVTITLIPASAAHSSSAAVLPGRAVCKMGNKGHIIRLPVCRVVAGPESNCAGLQSTQFIYLYDMAQLTYLVTLTVRDVTNIPYITYAPVSQQYVILPWVTQQGGSAVHATSHPLVALFSAPPCKSGDFILVRFTQSGSNVSSITKSLYHALVPVPTSISLGCIPQPNT